MLGCYYSLPHALGKWVTEQLVPIQRNMPSYFKDSFALKHLLDELSLPPNALLFTSDATSMYTNIKTTPALECISDFLRAVQQDYNHLHCEALIEALHIVFRNNLFKFGDTFWRQISGTAMGTPPAPAWATIFFAIYEMILVPRWQNHLLFYKRFIDDVFGVWLTHPDPIVNKRLWADFCTAMNGWHGLEWDTEEPSTSVNFMDMTITIVDGKLETTLYEKEQNLYLYIPPHSSHPKGVFSGLIFGQVLRIRRLCTKRADANMNISQFFDRLVARGHNPTTLLPLFRKAEENASAYLSRSPSEHELVRKQKWIDSRNQVYFHLQFHPEGPPASEIQALWRDIVSHPPGEEPLSELKNSEDVSIGISKLVVAYSRPLNLGNRFTVRDIHGRGKLVSSYLAK